MGITVSARAGEPMNVEVETAKLEGGTGISLDHLDGLPHRYAHSRPDES